MKFHEYLDRRTVESQLERCAEIMATADIDPEVFVEGFIADHDLQEGWKDFWQGAKDFAKKSWGNFKDKWYQHAAGSSPSVSIWDAAARRAFADRHTKAINALKGLHDFLKQNQQAKGLLSKNKTNMSVTDYIGELLHKLEQEDGISQLARGKEPQGSRAPDMAQMMKNHQMQQQAQQQASATGGATQQQVSAGGGGTQTTVSAGPTAGGVWTT